MTPVIEKFRQIMQNHPLKYVTLATAKRCLAATIQLTLLLESHPTRQLTLTPTGAQDPCKGLYMISPLQTQGC